MFHKILSRYPVLEDEERFWERSLIGPESVDTIVAKCNRCGFKTPRRLECELREHQELVWKHFDCFGRCRLRADAERLEDDIVELKMD